MINFESSNRSPESTSLRENIVLPRELVIDENEMTADERSVSLTIRIINGCFGANDVQFFSQNFPEYNGRKIDWAPSYQPIRTVRSNLNTTKFYKVTGRLSPQEQEK